MRLSRTIVYAVHAMLQLAQAAFGKPISRSQMASAGQLPERFLLEVLHCLVARGLVRAIRGVEGGYFLAQPAEQITLRDIFEAFDYPLRPFVPTVDGQPGLVRERLMGTLQQASDAALEELQKLTLAELSINSSADGQLQNAGASMQSANQGAILQHSGRP